MSSDNKESDMPIDDLEKFRWSGYEHVTGGRKLRANKRAHGMYVKGDIPHETLGRADQAGAHALAILLLLKTKADFQRLLDESEVEVVCSDEFTHALGLTTNARLRAIRALEAAGMITVEWSRRRAPRVRLVSGLFWGPKRRFDPK
jgi:hypothetical protein